MDFTKNKTVYIVDDDEDDRFLLREAILKIEEHVQIVEFKSGSEMLIQLKDINQSICFTDRTGYEHAKNEWFSNQLHP